MLTTYDGCMGSGKTAKILELIEELEEHNKLVLVYKPKHDTRGLIDYIESRNGKSHEALRICEDFADVEFALKRMKVDTMFFSEVHFFTDTPAFIKLVKHILAQGINVVTEGLDMSWKGTMFDTPTALREIADKSYTLTGTCECGNKSTHTSKLVDLDSEFTVGGDDMYIAHCEHCWQVANTLSDKKTAEDMVNSPSHYTNGSIECIEAMEAQLTPEEFRGYLKGCVIKYIWRERHKDGIESIKKAIWYLHRLTTLKE
ncbi:MAG: DUF3310 domain-containing protein [Nanoarchaeota archaeon]|nr:DUF3310 domain-containing protein [Nanoarchaeota archaeon]